MGVKVRIGTGRCEALLGRLKLQSEDFWGVRNFVVTFLEWKMITTFGG